MSTIRRVTSSNIYNDIEVSDFRTFAMQGSGNGVTHCCMAY